MYEPQLCGTIYSGAHLSVTQMHGPKLSDTHLPGARLSWPGAHLSGTQMSKNHLLHATPPFDYHQAFAEVFGYRQMAQFKLRRRCLFHLPSRLGLVETVGATTRNHKIITLLSSFLLDVTTFSLLSLRLCFHLRSILFFLFCQKKEGYMHVATATFRFTSATLGRRVLRLSFFPVS